jgi:hypothetical protein
MQQQIVVAQQGNTEPSRANVTCGESPTTDNIQIEPQLEGALLCFPKPAGHHVNQMTPPPHGVWISNAQDDLIHAYPCIPPPFPVLLAPSF